MECLFYLTILTLFSLCGMFSIAYYMKNVTHHANENDNENLLNEATNLPEDEKKLYHCVKDIIEKAEDKIHMKAVLEGIEKMANSKEARRFWIKSFFNNHITLVQDLNGIETPHFGYSHSNDDEYNNIITICILFWTAEISWNGRRKGA